MHAANRHETTMAMGHATTGLLYSRALRRRRRRRQLRVFSRRVLMTWAACRERFIEAFPLFVLVR